jgi:hypothetical protein
MMRPVSGQLPFSLGGAVIGVVGVVVGLAGLMEPLTAGLAVGAGLALALAELCALGRAPPSAGLVAGGVGVAVVVVVADGLVDLSLPGLVGGAGFGLVVSGAARYAEHVIAVEGPARPLAAVGARFVVPFRDLALALGGQPLREPPARPPNRAPGHRR